MDIGIKELKGLIAALGLDLSDLEDIEILAKCTGTCEFCQGTCAKSFLSQETQMSPKM